MKTSWLTLNWRQNDRKLNDVAQKYLATNATGLVVHTLFNRRLFHGQRWLHMSAFLGATRTNKQNPKETGLYYSLN